MSIPTFEKGTRVVVIPEPGSEYEMFEATVQDEVNISTDGPHLGWYIVTDDRGRTLEVPGLNVGQLS